MLLRGALARRATTRHPLVVTSDGETQEGFMKKKGNRSIPDFSRKRPSSPNVPLNQQQPTPVRAAPPSPIVKPHSTSSKSGRRGS
jgi:hypothetical protein